MSRGNPLLLIFAILLVATPTACTSYHIPDLTDEERTLLPDYSHLSPERLPDTLKQILDMTRDVQGAIVGHMKARDRELTFDGALALQRGAGFRMKGFRAFGTTVIDMTLTGDGAKVYLPPKRRAYLAGPDEPLPLSEGNNALTPRQLMESLYLGIGDGSQGGAEIEQRATSWILRYKQNNIVTQELELAKNTLFLMRSSRMDSEGKPVLHAFYDEYRLHETLWSPRSIRIEGADASFLLNLTLTDVQINRGLKPDALILTLPEGIEIIHPSTTSHP